MAGTIISDTDGVGANPVPPAEACSWTIQCPSNLFVSATLSLRGLPSSLLRFFDARTGELLVEYAEWNTAEIYLNLPNAVRLTFNGSGSSSPYNVVSGFTLQYSCRSDQCFGASFSGTESVPSQTSVYQSGVFSMNLSPGPKPGRFAAVGLNCRRQFACPLPTDTLYMEVAGLSATGKSGYGFSIASSFHGSILANYNDFFTLRSLLPASTSSETFTIVFKTPLNGKPLPSGVLYFTCQPRESTCSSPSRTQSTAVLPPLEVRSLRSDLDGVGSDFHYRTSEGCNFIVQCDENTRYMRYVAQLARYPASEKLALDNWAGCGLPNSLLTLENPSPPNGPQTAVIDTQQFDTLNSDLEATTYACSNWLSVVWKSSPQNSSTAGLGWDVTVSCSTNKCNSTKNLSATGSETFIPFGTTVAFLSDVDGAGADATLPTDSDCAWKYRCGRPGTLISLEGKLDSIYKVQFRDGSSTWTLPMSGSGIDSYYFPSALSGEVGFVSDSLYSTALSQGVTIRIGCVAQCGGNQQVYKGISSGTLTSDPDGESCNTRYAAGLSNCGWTIDCGVNSSIGIAMSASLANLADRPRFVSLATGEFLPYLLGDRSVSWVTEFYSEGQLRVIWSSAMTDSDPAQRCGWRIRFSCEKKRTVNDLCLQENTLQLTAATPTRGPTMSTASAITKLPKLYGMTCRWQLTCMSPSPTSTMGIYLRRTWNPFHSRPEVWTKAIVNGVDLLSGSDSTLIRPVDDNAGDGQKLEATLDIVVPNWAERYDYGPHGIEITMFCIPENLNTFGNPKSRLAARKFWQ
jgi:hypothetical protein